MTLWTDEVTQLKSSLVQIVVNKILTTLSVNETLQHLPDNTGV